MKRIQYLLCAIVTAGIMSGAMTNSVWADTAISSVNLTINLDAEAGDELSRSSVDIKPSSSAKYHVEDWEWVTSENRELEIGDTPKMRVTLLVDTSGYYFKGSYRESNVTIHNGDFVSASRKSDSKLVVTLITDPIEGTYDEPDNVEWKGSGFGSAHWEAPDDSSGYYDVYLYRESGIVTKLEGYHSTSYNFYPYMTKEGSYYFKVRTVPYTDEQKKNGKKSDWTESGSIYVAKEDVSDGKGQTGVNNTTQVGWILDGGVWYYKYPDGTYQKDSWVKVNDKWYLFDSQGKMLTGWQLRGNLWYYLNSGGDMAIGWLPVGGDWYYLNTADQGVEGAMHTGWLQVNGKTYYANTTGELVTGWTQVDGNWYYFYPGDFTKAVDTVIDSFRVDADGIWRR